MSWYRFLVSLAIVFFLGGCTPSVQSPSSPPRYSIDGEDLLALQALVTYQEGDASTSVEMFETLFDRTNKLEYIKEALRIGFSAGLPVEKLLEKALAHTPEDGDVVRLHVGVLLNNKAFEEAKEQMINLIGREKSIQNLTILGSIHFHLKEYDLALKYYDSIYKESQSEESLLAIVDLLDTHLDRTNEAISYLETVRRMNGCTKATCFRLVQIYGKTKNIDGLISTYKMLYMGQKEDQYANKVVELLLFKRDFAGAIAFLNQSNHDPLMLMDLHASRKEFEKAYKVAKRAYEDFGKLDYLGRVAIYEYEYNKDTITKALLSSVSEKFEKVIKTLEEPLYLNYYGYLLIDHDVDIAKGIALVKRALAKEPDSPYYIDSLAWGYYKLGRCQEAHALMVPILNTTSEQEIKDHYEKINACIRKSE
ncbi:hypothetical protein JWV37_07485 [Sulfurospirillum sp. T05]|uniref:Tetratricopeptide repeat protein n=1 Tax=Sulfurospirillum tamanense TaxID=2813362 RepID=A0ABS2WSH5_9BACT|nr:hypothetical protein [Sulfurospirillum tamanensis]MBN2964617.1 hypothetical protein [Sulfurospirillum tamanensis]